MPNADLFAKLGLFVARGFFDPSLCAAIRDELKTAPEKPGTVFRQGSAFVVDQDTRRVARHKISPETRGLVGDRLEALRPVQSRHFGVPLNGFEELQFLSYGPGGMYTPHRDGSDKPAAPDYMRARKVSLVLFLNCQTAQPSEGTYGGGVLTFYGLLSGPGCQPVGLGLEAEEGLLVAFRSDVLHEVTPVTHGRRFTLVGWFH
jgi:SM-20-related protein